MKLKKHIISIFVIALFAMGLVACGNTSTEAPTTAATTTAGQVTTAPVTTEPVTTEEQVTTETPVDLADLLDQLKTQYADTLENVDFLATEDLTLASSIGGIDISWSSNNTTYLDNDGTVHRPSYSDGDQTVILTATLTYGDDSESYGFFVTVQALAKSDAEKANEVFLVACAFPVKELWTSADEIVLLTTGEDADENSYTIVWSSDHPEVISTSGVIVQPEGENVLVTLTATITINEVAYTREVEFTVAKADDGTPVTSIAEGVALGEGVYVKYQGVTVIGVFSSGEFFFTDGTDIMYVYATNVTVEEGQVYDISGIFQWYYGAYELAGTTTQPVKKVDSTEALSTLTPEETTIGDIIDNGIIFTGTQHTVPAEGEAFMYGMKTVTAKLYYGPVTNSLAPGVTFSSSYQTYLVPADYDESVALDIGTTDAIMIYYRSDMTTLQSLHGEVITLDIMMYGYRTDYLVFYANFFGTLDDVVVNIVDDAEAVAAALDAVDFDPVIIEGTTLELPSELFGVALTYSSTNEAIINSTTGVVDLTGLTDLQAVTITVSAERGTASDTKDIVIHVGVLPIIDIADVYDDVAIAEGTLVKVQGIVTAQTKNSGYWIQDSTGALNVFTYDSTFANYVGKEITIIAAKDEYNGLYELKDIVEVVVVNETPTAITPADLTGVVLDATNLAAYKSQLISFTGYVLKYEVTATEGSFNITLINLTNGNEIKARIEETVPGYDALLAELQGYAVGDSIDVTGAIVSWYYTPQLAISSADVFAPGSSDATAEDLLAFDVAKFPTTLTLTDDYDIPALAFADVTVAISTELAANVTDDIADNDQLVVISPVTTDVVGTVTFTVSYGELSTDVVCTITLTAITEDDAVAADAALINTVESLEGNLVLPDPLYGSTFTVTGTTGDAVDYLNYTLIPGTIVVTRPAGADVTGTITVEVSQGSATPVEVTINVTIVKSEIQNLDLFFSEFGEGSTGSEKWLEIYNPTGADVDLSNYSLALFSNANTDASYTYALSGTLAAGDVYVVRNASVTLQPVIDATDLVEGSYPSGVCFFNGNDSVVLYHGDAIIDNIGQIGDAVDFNKDVTIVRKATVNFGDTNPYDTFVVADEWDVYPDKTTDYVGSHTMTMHAVDLFFSEFGEGSTGSEKWLEIYNGTGADVDLSNYSLALFSNANTDASYTYALSGTLANGDVYVVRNASVTLQAVIDATDLVEGSYPSGVCFFNGNDSVVLYHGDVVIDNIGQIGDAVDFNKDVTIVRMPTVFRGDANPYDTFVVADEWVVYPDKTTDYVGSHTVDYSIYE